MGIMDRLKGKGKKREPKVSDVLSELKKELDDKPKNVVSKVSKKVDKKKVKDVKNVVSKVSKKVDKDSAIKSDDLLAQVKLKLDAQKGLTEHQETLTPTSFEQAKHGLKSDSNRFIPLMVSDFDKLISEGGVERGNSIMISGGSGTGKSTFCLQSMYNSAVNRGEKGLYITFEEDPDNLKRHMKNNFGWDFESLEKKGLIKFIKKDPFELSREVESELAKAKGELLIKTKGITELIPRGFKPDRVAVDSLSALSAGFMDQQETYRLYLTTFLKSLNELGSVNIIIGETEQEPVKYSRTGIEEFLVDAVIVLYNIRHEQMRQQALEILKMRCSNHLKKMVPYKITNSGIEIYIEGKIFI